MGDGMVDGQGMRGRDMVGAPFDHFADAFPEVFAASHPEGSLGLATADDLVAVVDHRGRAPEDVAFLRDFVEGTGSAWTEAARRRFDVSLFSRSLPQPGQVFFAGRNGHGAVSFPTTEMLLNGRIPEHAFSSSLRAVVDGWFDGDLAQVPRPRGVSIEELRRYLEEDELPATYRQALAIAVAFRDVVDPDGLMNAWLSDQLRKGEWMQPAMQAGDDASSPEQQRYRALLGSALFILDPIPHVLLDHEGEALTLRLASEYALAAMQAGFESETVIGVIADYAGTQAGFFDDASAQWVADGEAGRSELASAVMLLAAEHDRRTGTAPTPDDEAEGGSDDDDGEVGSAGGSSSPAEAPPAGTPPSAAGAPGTSGASAARSFEGLIDEPESRDVEGAVAQMSPTRQETAGEFEASYPAVWRRIVEEGRVDFVLAAFSMAASGTAAERNPELPVSATLYKMTLFRLAENAGLIPDPEPSTSDGSEYLVTGAVHTFGGFEIPMGILNAGAGAIPIAP